MRAGIRGAPVHVADGDEARDDEPVRERATLPPMRPTFTPEDEEKLARGWPYLIVPVDGHKNDRTPTPSALKAWQVGDPVYFTEWPREVLHRYLRGGVATLFIDRVDSGIMQALETPGAPSADEALAAVERLFEEGYDTYNFKERDFVWGVETLAGTDATLGALVNAIERSKPHKKDGLNLLCRAALTETTAFLLLRASPAVAADARARMEQALAKAPKTEGDYHYSVEALDLALHGADAVRRTMGQTVLMGVPPLSFGATLDYAADDPGYIREAVKKAKPKDPMSVRVAYLGGPAVLAGLEKRRWAAAQMPSIVRDFGMLRDPAVVGLMLSLLGKAALKGAPLAWLQGHADYARPVLEALGSPEAKKALAEL
jgi:hypothetical protein